MQTERRPRHHAPAILIARNPRSRTVIQALAPLAVATAALMIAMSLWQSDRDLVPSPAVPEVTPAPGTGLSAGWAPPAVSRRVARLTGTGLLGCTTRAALARAMAFTGLNDVRALGRLIDAGLCVPLSPGTVVRVEEVGKDGPGGLDYDGAVKVRKKGTPEALWTRIEAVR